MCGKNIRILSWYVLADDDFVDDFVDDFDDFLADLMSFSHHVLMALNNFSSFTAKQSNLMIYINCSCVNE